MVKRTTTVPFTNASVHWIKTPFTNTLVHWIKKWHLSNTSFSSFWYIWKLIVYLIGHKCNMYVISLVSICTHVHMYTHVFLNMALSRTNPNPLIIQYDHLWKSCYILFWVNSCNKSTFDFLDWCRLKKAVTQSVLNLPR